ncbi:SDR family oxidoreductase [Lewinella sp. JB7]|uniref:SDR family oxidoreductase n=1 Tax=Lewinella sp. JB7 TaxID=2962887 RepID=UPI0020C9CE25|nr:SDR family oxidoreductase [Lewinella sp. JB7]MCP9236784.1 SDR family oxidoreductase [Lewinella sp. JB7]
MNKIDKLFGLKNRTIIVGGGAGQIGFSFCRILAEAGATILIADVDVEMAQQKLSTVETDALRNRIHVFPLDVTKKRDVLDFFRRAGETYGPLYGLINCFHFKGNTRKLDTSSNFFAPLEEYPEEAWNMVHDVNLKGSFLMTQSAIPYLEQNGGGVIVNISSTYGNVSANKHVYGDSGINSPVAYGTSKAALINFTRYVATHVADKNIRANCLSPGGVFNNQSDEFIANYTKLTPLGRMASADDYQGAILFLMSDASAYMTGANLNVDGGWTAW